MIEAYGYKAGRPEVVDLFASLFLHANSIAVRARRALDGLQVDPRLRARLGLA